MSTWSMEEAVATLQRWREEPPTEEDRIEFLKQSIKDMKNPDSQQEFKASITELGTTAVQTDEAFDNVNRSFKRFVDEHGSDFPELAGFQSTWQGYKNRWTNLLWISRDLASKTSGSYKEYDQIFLEMVESVSTKEKMAEAAEALERFSQGKPTDIPPDFSQQFLDLKKDVEDFQDRFYAYLEKVGTKLRKEATQLSLDIEDLKAQIEELTATIATALALIAVSSWWDLVASALVGLAIVPFAIARNEKKKELRQKQLQLEEVNRKQEALAHIKSEFDGLDPDIKLICQSLHTFSDIWAQFHLESQEFAKTLRELPTIEFPEEFKLRVELARTTARPLQDALEEYARVIHLSTARN